jgi:hypothetical protein
MPVRQQSAASLADAMPVSGGPAAASGAGSAPTGVAAARLLAESPAAP